MRAVVIHPDPMSGKILRFVLNTVDFDDVVLVDAGSPGLQAVVGHEVDLVLISADLLNDDGAQLAAELRTRRYEGPLLVMSTRRDIAITLAAFDAGADDVIVEPVTPQELIARVRAISRRYQQTDRQPMGTILKVGDAVLSVTDLTLQIGARAAIRLTPTEMRVLECLMRNAGLGVDRERLIERVWGFDFFGESNRVDVYMRRLRNKIERDPAAPEYLHTIRGVGYAFRATAIKTPSVKAVSAPVVSSAGIEPVLDAAVAN